MWRSPPCPASPPDRQSPRSARLTFDERPMRPRFLVFPEGCPPGETTSSRMSGRVDQVFASRPEHCRKPIKRAAMPCFRPRSHPRTAHCCRLAVPVTLSAVRPWNIRTVGFDQGADRAHDSWETCRSSITSSESSFLLREPNHVCRLVSRSDPQGVHPRRARGRDRHHRRAGRLRSAEVPHSPSRSRRRRKPSITSRPSSPLKSGTWPRTASTPATSRNLDIILPDPSISPSATIVGDVQQHDSGAPTWTLTLTRNGRTRAMERIPSSGPSTGSTRPTRPS